MMPKACIALKMRPTGEAPSIALSSVGAPLGRWCHGPSSTIGLLIPEGDTPTTTSSYLFWIDGKGVLVSQRSTSLVVKIDKEDADWFDHCFSWLPFRE